MPSLSIASWITLSRLGLLPLAVLPVCLGWQCCWLMASATCAVAGATDTLDGHLARQKNCVTAFGALLDPLVDKVFTLTIMLLLAVVGAVPFWALAVLAAREATVSLLRIRRFRTGLPISPNVWGKTKTVFLTVAVVGLLLRQDLRSQRLLGAIDASIPLGTVLDTASWVLLLATALALLSGGSYLLSYLGLSFGAAVPEGHPPQRRRKEGREVRSERNSLPPPSLFSLLSPHSSSQLLSTRISVSPVSYLTSHFSFLTSLRALWVSAVTTLKDIEARNDKVEAPLSVIPSRPSTRLELGKSACGEESGVLR